MTEEGIDFLDSRIPDILSSIDRARIELVFDTRNYLETGGRGKEDKSIRDEGCGCVAERLLLKGKFAFSTKLQKLLEPVNE